MWSDYAFSSEARPSISITLEVVYAVDANDSFDAKKLSSEDRRRAVIRTVGGEGEIYISDMDPLAVRTGTVVFLDFNRVKRYKPKQEAWRFWYFEYECADNADIPLNRPVEVSDSARDESDAKECMEVLRRSSETSAAYASALFSAMYHRWHAEWSAGTESCHPREPKIREAVTEMRRNLGEPLLIPALAAKYGMSERAFRDAFRAVMDLGPKAYYDRLRLEKAAELLRLNSYSIGEIADKLGYSSQFHFSRAFHELFGVPPSTYASVIRNEN